MKDIDSDEFHILMMDYRAASPIFAQKAYQRVLDHINQRLNEEDARNPTSPA